MTEQVRKSSGRKKKPTGYPKRPLSSYNIFFQQERQKMLLAELQKSPLPPHMIANALASGRNRPHRKRHGKLDFQVLVKTVAARWKSITSEEKKVYETYAKTDKQRYELELEAWKKHHDQLGNPIIPCIPETQTPSCDVGEIIGSSAKVEIDFSEEQISSFSQKSSSRIQLVGSSLKSIHREGKGDHDTAVNGLKHLSKRSLQCSVTTLKPQTQNDSYTSTEVGTSDWLANNLDNDCLEFFVDTFTGFQSDAKPQSTRSRAA